ncbi:hypothetical protein Fmac_019968 [Flemingia macrophylla]|uniref:Transcription repressor n=1 Tax=Flemingia macrophylla TaxID=520843 RepID=A0ABD1M9Q1_9FABA
MPKRIRDYLFKIKNPRPQLRLTSSKSWNNILSGCKHPRTPSFALYSGRNEADHVHVHQHKHVPDKNTDAATLADIDRFLLENFRSLYLKDDEPSQDSKRVTEGRKQGSILYDGSSSPSVETPRHIRGSTRFLVKAAGFSGSVVEDALTSDEAASNSTMSTFNDASSSSEKEAMDHALPDNSIALLTHSTNPCDDFRRSMQEMVNGHQKVVDWDFMEELLFCYLNLNDKISHKFILSAFVDLVTAMRRNSEPSSAKVRSVRTVRSREIIG